MNQNKLIFEDQKLVVDYMSFKFQKLNDFDKKKIVNHIFELGFNCVEQDGNLQESLTSSQRNNYKAFFVNNSKGWSGLVIHFSGLNSQNFYNLIKKELVDWKLFSGASLSRFDLNYSRANKNTDKISSSTFLINCQQELNQTNRKVSLEKNRQGFILKIGNRKTNNYFRIYEINNSLKFEYEMKGKLLLKYSQLLVENRVEEFEKNIYKHFLFSFYKLLLFKQFPVVHYSYLDWLLIKLRPFRRQNFIPRFKFSYIDQKIILLDHQKYLFTFLQFLIFIEDLDFKYDYLGTTQYRQLIFPIQSFLEYTKQSKNYYQLKKVLDFLKKLQSNSLIEFFTDNSYRSLMAVPKLEIEKNKQNSWIVHIWIAEQFFIYKHPFLLPSLYNKKLPKDKLEVQFYFIQVWSSPTIEKSFDIKNFIKNYSSILNNQRKTRIKSHFIELIKIFEDNQLIESDYKFIENGMMITTSKLTTRNISEGFIIFERLII